MGQFGLECKSLMCRWISIDDNGSSTDYDPEYDGTMALMAMLAIMFFLNLASYIKVRVIRKITTIMYKQSILLAYKS